MDNSPDKESADTVLQLRALADDKVASTAAYASDLRRAAREIEMMREAARELISCDIDAAGGSPEAWAERMKAWHALRAVVGYHLPGDPAHTKEDQG